jgi:hypothetical protein
MHPDIQVIFERLELSINSSLHEVRDLYTGIKVELDSQQKDINYSLDKLRVVVESIKEKDGLLNQSFQLRKLENRSERDSFKKEKVEPQLIETKEWLSANPIPKSNITTKSLDIMQRDNETLTIKKELAIVEFRKVNELFKTINKKIADHNTWNKIKDRSRK